MYMEVVAGIQSAVGQLSQTKEVADLDGFHVEGSIAEDVPAYVQVGDTCSVFPARQLITGRRWTRRECQHCRLHTHQHW